MNPITLTMGLAALLFGLYITVLRFVHPGKLAKLEALKELFGDQAGNRIHLAAYSCIPLAVGVMLVFAGANGISVF